MKFRTLLFVFTCALFILSGLIQAQEVITLNTSAVAEISEADPDADQNDSDLRIQSKQGASFQSFIMFDISSLSGDISSAGLKLYMAQHEDESGTTIKTPYRVMLLPMQNTTWDNSLTWNLAIAEQVINKDDYSLAYVDVNEYNKEHLTGSDSKWYYINNALITNHIQKKIDAGETKAAFALVALDSVPEHDVWVGNWSNKVPTLEIVKGTAPAELEVADVAELFEATPDAVPDEGTGDLKIQATEDGNDKMALLKFDLSEMAGNVTDASIQVYGSQHEGEFEAMNEYWIEVYEAKSAQWTGSELTYNVFNASIGHEDVGVALFDMNNADGASSNLRGIKSKIISHVKLTELINSYLQQGKSELALVLKAGTTNNNFDAWVGGTWRGPKLHLQFGEEIETLVAVNDGEVNSSLPDAVNPDDNAGDLKMQNKDDGTVIKSFIKFDISELNADDILSAKLQVYGAQHEAEGFEGRYLIDLFGVENTDLVDNTTLTYNVSEGFTATEKALARINLPEEAMANNKIWKYKYFEQYGLTDYIKARLDSGDTEIAFVLKANEVINSHDAYIGGANWRAPELKIYNKSVTAVAQDTLVKGQEILAIEDSWVGESAQFENHDGEADMNVTSADGDDRIAYIKFDITKSSAADMISLVLKGAQKDGDGWTAMDSFMVEIYGCMDNTWAEAGLIWVNRPEISTDALATLDINVTSSILFSFKGEELTKFINERITAGDEFVTLAVKGKNETPGSRAWFSSKDWVSPTLSFYYSASYDVAAPVFSIAPGLYPPPSTSVSITTTTTDANIYYTLDGSVPTEESSVYEGGVTINEDDERVTLQAVAIKDGVRSFITSGEYVIGTQEPYDGTPWTIPGKVTAWKFDLGGQGVAYNESNDKVEGCGDNSTIQANRSDNALIDGCCTGDRCDIGWGADGEWTEYTVNVSGTNCFTVVLRYLKALDGPAQIQIDEVDENNNVIKNLVAVTDVPQNADDNDWGADPYDLPSLSFDQSFELEDGEHTIRVTWVKDQWNFTELEFHAADGCTSTDALNVFNDQEGVKIYPNPANDVLNVEFVSSSNADVEVFISDITGKQLVNDVQRNLPSGRNVISYNISSIQNGIYFFGYIADGKKYIKKFIVNK